MLLYIFGLLLPGSNKNKNMQCKKEQVQYSDGPPVLNLTSQTSKK